MLHPSAQKLVDEQFPGCALLPLDSACKLIGIPPKTARLQLLRRTFPLPTIKTPGVKSRQVPAPLVVAYLSAKFFETGVPVAAEVAQ